MSSPSPAIRISFVWKVLLAFGFLVLAALLVFSLLANRAAAREVRGFMFQGGMTDSALLAQDLADYYQAHQTWDGVGGLLSSPGPWRRMMNNMMGGGGRQGPLESLPADVSLTDSEGRVVAGLLPRGRVLRAQDLAGGTPVRIGDRTVGFLMVSAPSASTLGESLIGRLSRGIWVVGGLTGLGVLVVGIVLVSGLMRPVRELTAASRALAGGDLGRRVPVHSQDEVGELSAAFNHMAENLQQAEQLRRELTADIAHELRNPLAVMQANLEALADGVYPPTPDRLDPVLNQVRLLSRLIEDLRTLALADAGQLALDRVPSNLMTLAGRVVEGYRQQAEAAGVELLLSGGSAAADVDPMRVEQILGNLLSNAIRHSERGAQVLVDVGKNPTGERVTVRVADQGEGIPPEAMPMIFERFYRGDRSRSRSEGGTGLGLAIARRLAEVQGGEIQAANRTGGGAEFTVSFPAATG